MEFPECKRLKEVFDKCVELRKEVVWNSLMKGQLPPKEGDCEVIDLLGSFSFIVLLTHYSLVFFTSVYAYMYIYMIGILL